MVKPDTDASLDALKATCLSLLGWLDLAEDTMDEKRETDYAAPARAMVVLIDAGRLPESGRKTVDQCRKRAG